MGIKSSTDRLTTQEISQPKTKYKNQENSSHFGKKTDSSNFDFYEKLRQLTKMDFVLNLMTETEMIS